MGTAPRKQLAIASRKQPKQPKRTYKIPRSLKKAIRKKLVKIVKERDEEHERNLNHHEEYHFDIANHSSDIRDIWNTHQTNNKLGRALRGPISRVLYAVGFEHARQVGGLPKQKDWLRHMLRKHQGTEELRIEARAWLIERGEDAAEVEKLGQEEEADDKDESEDEASCMDTTEEFDWTSTSTLDW